VVAYCAYQLISARITDNKGEQVYEKAAQAAAGVTGSSSAQAGSQASAAAETETDASGNEVAVRSIDFTALKAINAETVGWLVCEGTVLDYPVVQGADNSYYLTHLIDGTEHRFGTLFVDYLNSPGFTDDNTIIYGHHIKAGDMFKVLSYYQDQGDSYYQQHPTMMLYTPERNYRLDIFAGCLIDGENGVPLVFASREEFAAYIARLKASSTFSSSVAMTPEDKMVTLYTCAYDFEGARYVVCAKLVPLN